MAESITTLCQTGNLEAAYRQASASLAERPDSQFAQNDMFTVVLACLKKYSGQADVGATARWVRKLAALQLPGVVWRDEQICWEMHNLLRVLFKRQYPPHAEIAELLLALVGLPLVEVASVGRSRLLQAALKFQEQLPTTWWDWWNLDLLRPEDFVKESYTPAGTCKAIRLPALAESAYGSYAKGLLKRLTAGAGSARDVIAATEALIPKMEALAADHTDYSWLGYHRAKLLLALGDTAAALPTLLQIVRQKSTEYWAWQLLGETLRPTDTEAALACYYRAAQCPADEMYLGRLRETLAGMLHATGYLGEAQQQLHLLAQARQSEGKSLPTTAGQLASQPWFSQAYPPDKTIAATLLATAEEAAYGDLPWQSVALQYIGDEQPDKPALARLLPLGKGACPLSVPLKKYRWLSKLPVGTPLQVKCESVAGRLRVILLQKRPAGTLWDVVPAQIAVVTNLSLDKARAFFTAAPGQYGAIQLAEVNLGNIQPGDSVQVRLQVKEKEGVVRLTVLAAESTSATAPASVCRSFKGRFSKTLAAADPAAVCLLGFVSFPVLSNQRLAVFVLVDFVRYRVMFVGQARVRITDHYLPDQFRALSRYPGRVSSTWRYRTWRPDGDRSYAPPGTQRRPAPTPRHCWLPESTLPPENPGAPATASGARGLSWPAHPGWHTAGPFPRVGPWVYSHPLHRPALVG